MQREQRVLARIVAASRTLHTDYCFSHESAALLHGLGVYRLAEEVHVSQAWKPKVRRERGTTLRRHPVTTLERTMVDCARWLPGERGLVVADSGLRAGADRRVAASVLAEAAGRPGVRQARRILELADARSESVGESRLRWTLHSAGVEVPSLAVAVETWRGTVWVDAGWPDLKVGIEFDGAVKYSGGEYGDPRERLLAEKRRHDALTEAGWAVLRVTWEELADPDRLIARIRRALAEAARRRLAR
ncbi:MULTISPECIES: hypothetical protein [unclassified Isoptericola]|uniref:hypothetical protein n=1 Tax=unclassified Isoptericola TaxID=2623355 RepID=UPI003661C391